MFSLQVRNSDHKVVVTQTGIGTECDAERLADEYVLAFEDSRTAVIAQVCCGGEIIHEFKTELYYLTQMVRESRN